MSKSDKQRIADLEREVEELKQQRFVDARSPHYCTPFVIGPGFTQPTPTPFAWNDLPQQTLGPGWVGSAG